MYFVAKFIISYIYRVSKKNLTTFSFAHIYTNSASISTSEISRERGHPPVSPYSIFKQLEYFNGNITVQILSHENL